MANCNQCSRDVGCGCNLINGSCASCYGKTSVDGETTLGKRVTTKRVVYQNLALDAPPNTEFEVILKTQGLTKEEKLKRINDILEKARLEIK